MCFYINIRVRPRAASARPTPELPVEPPQRAASRPWSCGVLPTTPHPDVTGFIYRCRNAWVAVAAGALATLGFRLFAANTALVVREHSPHSLRGILVSRLGDAAGDTPEESSPGVTR